MATKTATVRKFEVGQRVWRFDENYRVYAKNEQGRTMAGPIYSEYFRPMTIMAIEGRSYVVVNGHPADERWSCRTLVGFAKAEMLYRNDGEKDDGVWVNGHRHELAELLRNASAAKLREVAEVLGFTP
jgi:hypothetical protein